MSVVSGIFVGFNIVARTADTAYLGDILPWSLSQVSSTNREVPETLSGIGVDGSQYIGVNSSKLPTTPVGNSAPGFNSTSTIVGFILIMPGKSGA